MCSRQLVCFVLPNQEYEKVMASLKQDKVNRFRGGRREGVRASSFHRIRSRPQSLRANAVDPYDGDLMHTLIHQC